MILITGGAGYIGSHCAMMLLDKGYNIVVFDNLSTGHIETINTLKKHGNVEFIQGDLQNKNDIDKVFEDYKVDSVLHFAASSLVEESVKNPQKYYLNNVYGSLNLFESMLRHNVMKIVFSSTAAIYGEPQYIPIDEKHPVCPVNPYGQSKLIIENILDNYNKAYNLRSVRLRYFNVAGADSQNRIGEWHETETHLIPNILKSTFKENKVFEIFGNDYSTKDGTCVRDYINIEDLANAHILALNYLNNNGKTISLNLGTSEGNTVKEIFNYCEKICDKPISVRISPRREGDPSALIADNTLAKEILNWIPQQSIDTSINTAYNWEIKLQENIKI